MLLTSATETGVHCLSWVASGLGPDSDRIEFCLAIRALVWSLGWAHGMGVCVAVALALGGDLLDRDGRGGGGACAPPHPHRQMLAAKCDRPCHIVSGARYRCSGGYVHLCFCVYIYICVCMHVYMH